jgi:hypothetical protein
MAETLTGPAGTTIEVDPDEQKFAAAMAAPEPGTPPDYPAPRRRDPEAPHGRNDDGTAKAPYGLKSDGTPKLTAGGPGRGKTGPRDAAREQKPGTAPAAAKPGASAAAEAPEQARARRAAEAQSTLELGSAIGTIWAMFSLSRSGHAYKTAEARGDQAAMRRSTISYERAQVIQLDAAACAIHAEACGASAAEAATHNTMAAALVDRLSLFNGIASVGIAFLPLVYQIIANHAPAEAKDEFPPELLTLGVLPPKLLLEKLAADNAVKMARAQSAILADKIAAEAELERLRAQAA